MVDSLLHKLLLHPQMLRQKELGHQTLTSQSSGAYRLGPNLENHGPMDHLEIQMQ